MLRNHFCLRRMRDKYEAEIAELERSERLSSQKYNETKVHWMIFNSRLIYDIHTADRFYSSF